MAKERTAFGIRRKGFASPTYFDASSGQIIDMTSEILGGPRKHVVVAKNGEDFTVLDWEPRAADLWRSVNG